MVIVSPEQLNEILMPSEMWADAPFVLPRRRLRVSEGGADFPAHEAATAEAKEKGGLKRPPNIRQRPKGRP